MTRPLTIDERTRPVPDDPDIIQTFTEAIQGGLPVSLAAPKAGIVQRTAWDWIAQGDADMERNPRPVEELAAHALFAHAYKQALVVFAEENLAYVRASRDTGSKGWLPAMTLLERRMPSEFSRRTEVKVESTNLHVVAQLPPGAERDIMAYIADRHRAELANATGETPALLPPPTTPDTADDSA